MQFKPNHPLNRTSEFLQEGISFEKWVFMDIQFHIVQ